MSTARESQLSVEPSFVTCFNLGRERGGGGEERDQQISASTEGTIQATFTLFTLFTVVGAEGWLHAHISFSREMYEVCTKALMVQNIISPG